MSQIEITPALLSDLRQKAEAATPGPWKVIETPRPDYSEDLRIVPCDAYGNSRGDGPIGDVFGGYKRPVAENAAHIAAASPAVVLAIIDEIKRLNERFDEQKLLATRMIEHAAEQKKEIERLRDRLDKLVCPNCGDLRKCCMCDVEQPEASNADQA
jgi:hypothetical protein